MKQGLYEQIINNLTKQQLAELDPVVYDIGKEPFGCRLKRLETNVDINRGEFNYGKKRSSI